MTTLPPEPPPPRDVGWVASLANVVKGLSLTNVLILALLVAVLGPTYLVYRIVNDQSLLTRVLSHYEEIRSDKTPCTVRTASMRGGEEFWAITTGWAYQGSDRYTIGVSLDHKPDDMEMASYCETLFLIVDFMRGNREPPAIIWQYRDIQGREGEKGER